MRQEAFPAHVLLADLRPQHLGAWRDARLKIISPASALRDMTLLSHVLEVARREWQWIPANLMRDVRKPPQPAHRERVIAHWEILCMLCWSRRLPVRSVT